MTDDDAARYAAQARTLMDRYAGVADEIAAMLPRLAREGEMTDRELLMRAARAAGITLHWSGDRPGVAEPDSCEMHDGERWLTEWNPLDDDGDAFRLAVRLRMRLQYRRRYPGANVSPEVDEMDVVAIAGEVYAAASVRDWANPEEAARRAIVRAAAQLAGDV